MPSGVPNLLTEDEIDDLLYFARTGEVADFSALERELVSRECWSLAEILGLTEDEHTRNGPLHMAAANGHIEIIIHIIKALSVPTPQNPAQLALLNAQNKAGNTALHYAALNGHLAVVKALLEAGADPTLINSAGHDAVYEAEVNDKKEVVEWVLKEGEGLEEGIGGAGGGVGDGDAQLGEEEEEEEGEEDNDDDDVKTAATEGQVEPHGEGITKAGKVEDAMDSMTIDNETKK